MKINPYFVDVVKKEKFWCYTALIGKVYYEFKVNQETGELFLDVDIWQEKGVFR